MAQETLKEMLVRQRTGIPEDKKIYFLDLKRLNKHLKKSIFDSECSIYNGSDYYPTVDFIPFYMGKQKFILHRLLYENFVGPLLQSEYIKFKCKNKGRCCNINHLQKVKPKHLLKSVNKPIEKVYVEKIIVDFGF